MSDQIENLEKKLEDLQRTIEKKIEDLRRTTEELKILISAIPYPQSFSADSLKGYHVCPTCGLLITSSNHYCQHKCQTCGNWVSGYHVCVTNQASSIN